MKPWKNDKAERLTLFLTQIKKKTTTKQNLRNFKVALDAVYLLLATIFPDLGQAKNGDQQPQAVSGY